MRERWYDHPLARIAIMATLIFNVYPVLHGQWFNTLMAVAAITFFLRPWQESQEDMIRTLHKKGYS